MAGAAFPLWIVIRGFGRMARGAERSAGSQLRDGCRRVARVASLVRDLESRVRGLRIGECVASRTRAAGRVMVGVAVLALGDGRRWRECDRSRVTLDALPLGMLCMDEIHRTGCRRVTGDRHRDRHFPGRRELLLLVTRRASRRRGLLMVADVAAARWLKRQAGRSRCRLMADEARDFCVPRMRERIGRGGWWQRRGCGG